MSDKTEEFENADGFGALEQTRYCDVERIREEDKTGAARCQHTASFIIDVMVQLLEEQAVKDGGTVRIDDIRRIVASMKETPADLWRYYKANFENCVAAARQQANENYANRRAYFRLVVETFAHLFAGNRRPAAARRILPRAIVRPFLSELSHMVGAEKSAEHETACQSILTELLATHGFDFNWELFFEDPRVIAVLLETQVAVAQFFSDFERGKKTFVDRMNQNMSDAGSRGGGGDWRSSSFTDKQFSVLMYAFLHFAIHICRHPTEGHGQFGIDDPSDRRALENFIKHISLHEIEFHQLHILIVDNNEYSRGITRLELAGLGCKTISYAGNGIEAQEKLTESVKNVDVVLLDLDLPKTSGSQFLRWLRKSGSLVPDPDVPVVILTSDSDVDKVTEAMKLGIHGFMVKPTSSALLASHISAAMTCAPFTAESVTKV